MPLEVVPIINTVIDWNQYLMAAKQILGRSVSQQLDTIGMKLDSLASFVATLGAFREPNAKPSEILSDPGSLLKHVSLGFLILASNECLFEVMEETSLNLLSTDSRVKNTRLAVLTGNLEEWRTSIINGSSNNCGYECRLLMDKCLLHFELIGLGGVWSNYRKKILNDKTFQLTEK